MTQNDDTDVPEDLTKEQIWNRLKRLEETVYPSRREVVAGGLSAALAGGAAYSLTGRGSAADTSSDQAGAAGKSIDVYLDQLRDPGGDVVADVDDTGAIDWMNRGHTNLGPLANGGSAIPVNDDLDLQGSQSIQDANAIGTDSQSITATNLSGVSGDFVGQIKQDDGTNTREGGMLCRWTGSGWTPIDYKLQVDAGQTTAPANSVSQINLSGIGAGTELEVDYGIETDPDADAQARVELFWDDSAAEHALRVLETRGTTDVVVSYRVYEIGGTFS